MCDDYHTFLIAPFVFTRLLLDEIYHVVGYEFAYRNQDEKCGGGVRIYITDTIKFKVRNDVTKLDESIENLWIEI